MSIAFLFAAAVPLVWLLPNHYYPWLSAWQDGAAIALLLAAVLCSRQPLRIDRLLAMAALVAAFSAAGQWVGGIIFGGDALMVGLYLAVFVLSLALGNGLSLRSGAPSTDFLEALATGMTAAALLSVGIALVQWTGATSLGLLGTDLPPGGRPFANVAQPNHLCSLLFLGLTGVLLLRDGSRIGWAGYWFGGVFLVLGMVMSGSRTGWLQILVLMGITLWPGRSACHVRWPHVAALVLVFIVATLAWPRVNDALLLTGGRGVADQIDGGARGPLWRALLDAVARAPWAGFGWQQVALAQQTVALDHPPVQRHFEHSHNELLDLVLWAGVPVALAIGGLVGLSLWRLLRAPGAARVAWPLAAVAGIATHAMLEFPLEYAYFLIPVGLLIGASGALARPAAVFTLSPGWAMPGAAVVGVVFGAVAVEYLQAEQSHRLLRLETARIGTDRVTSPPPDLRLLTQLGAFLRFARQEAAPGMTPAEVDEMRRVAQRFAYPPSMLRLALAEGLNGRPDESRLTLLRLCSIHPPPRCDEARASWLLLQGRHPGLKAIPPP